MVNREVFKGVFMDSLTQVDVARDMSHVNSMLRKEYGDVSTIARFESAFGKKILPLLDIRYVESARLF